MNIHEGILILILGQWLFAAAGGSGRINMGMDMEIEEGNGM